MARIFCWIGEFAELKLINPAIGVTPKMRARPPRPLSRTGR
jgi:hypothetical protein